MNSRFKFVKSVDPQNIASNATKSKFSKLTLAATKAVAVETVDGDVNAVKKVTQLVAQRTTTTMTEPTHQSEDKNTEGGRKPKMLLYESTISHSSMAGDETKHSDIMTDDDTDSASSSIELSMRELSLKTQPLVDKINPIEMTTATDNAETNENEVENLLNLSHQFKSLGISQNKTELKKNNTNRSTCSIHSISSTESVGNEKIDKNDTNQQSESDEIIVLSDTDEEEPLEISQEPPLKPALLSNNDAGAFNVTPTLSSKVDDVVMEKVNHFFDNIPHTEFIENSFNTTLISTSLREEVYVSESSEDESEIHSTSNENDQQNTKNVTEATEKTEPKRDELEYSGNNIVLDIPVVKSSSDQPHQLIKSLSGIRLTGSNSSPVIRTSVTNTNSEFVRTPTGNVLLKKTGSSIKVNSNGGQVNISAKININIQITSTDSSSDTSSEDKETETQNRRKTLTEAQTQNESDGNLNQSSDECTQNATSCDPNYIPTPMDRSIDLEPNDNNEKDDLANGTTESVSIAEKSIVNETPKSHKNLNNYSTCSNRTPNTVKNMTLKTPKASAKKHPRVVEADSPKTPTTASKLKQFQYVAPKSLTKSSSKMQKNQEIDRPRQKQSEKNGTKSGTTGAEGFVVDENIPVEPHDQRLLHEVYGDAWKTPEIIRSYSAIKGKPNGRMGHSARREVSSVKHDRYSKGFHLFKRNINDNLNSTMMNDALGNEISKIEAPNESIEKNKKSAPIVSPKQTSDTNNILRSSPSQSMINRLQSKSDASMIRRPKRNVVRKRILDSPDDLERSTQSNQSLESDWEQTESGNDSDSSDDVNFKSCTTSKSSGSTRKLNPRMESTRKQNPSSQSTRKKAVSKKPNKNDIIFLDLSSEEVSEVNGRNPPEVSEEDLANITRRFLETDLNDDSEKPKKKLGRKLFTPLKYDEEMEDLIPEERETVRRKISPPTEIIEIPKFTQHTKLFDSKRFGSPSFKAPDGLTPRSKLKGPKSLLDDPPKTFPTYGFLKSLDVQSSMLLCHPDAKIYRENFSKNKEKLTEILFTLFNEKVFGSKLKLDVVWNKKLTTTAGRYKYTTNSKISYIELSEKVLTSADRLRCTLIHEMCHAATWEFDKQKGHGSAWKSWAKQANKVFPELPIIEVCHNYNIDYKYTYQCEMCGAKSHSHSKSKKVENIRCALCHGQISIYLNKKQNGAVVMTPVRQPSGFSKYVQKNYKLYKKPGVTHAEVMRTLSVEYAKLTEDEKKLYSSQGSQSASK